MNIMANTPIMTPRAKRLLTRMMGVKPTRNIRTRLTRHINIREMITRKIGSSKALSRKETTIMQATRGMARRPRSN